MDGVKFKIFYYYGGSLNPNFREGFTLLLKKGALG